MKPGMSQSTQLRQELKINPRLYQAMDLLYMPLLDLQQHLKQELLNNPFLDLVEAEEEDEEEQTEAEASPETPEEKERGEEIDWEEILLDGFDTAGGRREEHEEREYYEPVTVATRDLSDHLRDQVSLLELSPREMLLADEFLGNINDDGYLATPVAEIIESVNEMITSGGRERGPGLRRPSAVHGRRRRGDAQDSAGPRSARSRRARPAGMPDASAGGGGPEPVRAVSPRARLLRGADRPPLERDLEAIRNQRGRRSEGGRRDREARSEARTAIQVRRRELHHSRPDRRQDRRPVSRLPQRRESAAPSTEQGVSGDRARQEEVRGREQGVHLQQAELGELDDSGDRAAAADDAQGDELHRRQAARILRERRAVPQAAHAARSR